MTKNMETLFDEFQMLSWNIKALGSIVQNEGIEPTNEQLQEWTNLVNNNINKLNSLRENVIRFFQD